MNYSIGETMESNTIFTSVRGEIRWLTQMSQIFPEDNISEIEHNVPPCVLMVPKTLTQTKPDAYAPRLLGLGPYHHLLPELYKMQRIKLAAIKTFLNREQQHNFFRAVQALNEMEPVLRLCYDQYLDLEPYTLAWIVEIDSVYLLHFMFDNSPNPHWKTMVGDVLMLENQIPVILLNQVCKVLDIFPSEWRLFEEFDRFCMKHSPLKLNQEFHITADINQVHLLHRMYHLIVTNRGIKPQRHEHHIINLSSDTVIEMVKQGADVAATFGIPGASMVQQHLSFMEKIPWGRILALFGTGDPDEQNNLVEEIDIPSVSQLQKIARIEFELTEGGIRGVRFEEEERKFYLPMIIMSPNSEIILRNLMAFEAAFFKDESSVLEIAEYVDLMCGIVDTTEDVEILRSKGIIEGDLPDEEIAGVFNGIRRSTGKGEKSSSNIEKAVDVVNERYDNTMRVKALRFVKKHVYRSWKFLTVVSAVIVLMLLAVQAFCQVYGCGSRSLQVPLKTFV